MKANVLKVFVECSKTAAVGMVTVQLAGNSFVQGGQGTRRPEMVLTSAHCQHLSLSKINSKRVVYNKNLFSIKTH